MLAFLTNLTPAALGEIIGGVLGGLGLGVSGYALYKTKQPQDYATRDELRDLERKHDQFEDNIRAQIRDGEQRTHKRLDVLSSKMDESIGLQKADSRLLQSLLNHLITPAPSHHDHQS